jgi:oxygen-independent coproporphyrinogen-3 oxidase
MLSFGISAIGRVGPTYYQNVKTLPEYYAALDAGRLPVARGVELSADDLVRRTVIQALACNFHVRLDPIYFARELEDLKNFESDGLVEARERATYSKVV